MSKDKELLSVEPRATALATWEIRHPQPPGKVSLEKFREIVFVELSIALATFNGGEVYVPALATNGHVSHSRNDAG